jgi:membrane protein
MIKLERLIVTSPPVAFVIRKLKHWSFPGFHGLPLYDVIQFFFKQINRYGINERAASISFNLLMALPPLLIFLFTLIPYLPFHQAFVDELLRLVKDVTPDQKLFSQIEALVHDFVRPRGGLLSFGILLVLFYSSNAMIGVMKSFDRSLHTMHLEEKNWFQFRWHAIRLTLILLMVFIGTILISITQGAVWSKILGWLSIEETFAISLIVTALRWVLIIALYYYSIGLIYRYAPSVRKKWKIDTPGTMLATFLILLSLWILGIFVSKLGGYNTVYGSLGTIMMVMVIIFVDSLILLIGFELNLSINHLKAVAEHRNEMEEEELKKQGITKQNSEIHTGNRLRS